MRKASACHEKGPLQGELRSGSEPGGIKRQGFALNRTRRPGVQPSPRAEQTQAFGSASHAAVSYLVPLEAAARLQWARASKWRHPGAPGLILLTAGLSVQASLAPLIYLVAKSPPVKRHLPLETHAVTKHFMTSGLCVPPRTFVTTGPLR